MQGGLVVVAVAGCVGGFVGVAGGFDAAELFLAAGGAEFFGDVSGCPGCFGFVGAAAGQELAVGEVADVDAVDVGQRWPGRWPRNWAVFSASGMPASSMTLRPAEVVAMP